MGDSQPQLEVELKQQLRDLLAKMDHGPPDDKKELHRSTQFSASCIPTPTEAIVGDDQKSVSNI